MGGELKKLREAGGKWCFIDGHRFSRLARIKELEAKKKTKPKAKPAAILSEGTNEKDREKTTTEKT